MYGNLNLVEQKNGIQVAKFAGQISIENAEFMQRLARSHRTKITETMLCNKILDAKLDELRTVYNQLIPKVEADEAEIENIFEKAFGK